jgi:hypothetical protein
MTGSGVTRRCARDRQNGGLRFANPPYAQQQKCFASFVVEYSAHFVVKIFRAFTPSGFSRTAFHIAVRTVARLSFFAVRYPIG